MLDKIKNNWINKTPLRIVSDVLFLVAVLMSAYTLISTKLIQNALPPGVCPINNQSEFYVASIILLVLSFVLSLFDKKK